MKPKKTAGGLDHEALLAALVLAPATYSRNRFFELYKDPDVFRVRRRATQIRSIVRQLAAASVPEGDVVLHATPSSDGLTELRYTVPSLGLTRTARLDAMEMALVRYAVLRARRGEGPAPGDPDRARVEAALARLAPQSAGM